MLSPSWTIRSRVLVCFVILLISGCSSSIQPDLDRIYAHFTEPPGQQPVIIIPGTMGSKLVDQKDDREIWPGGLMNFVTGATFDRLKLPVSSEGIGDNKDTLEPTGLFGGIAGRNYYGKIIETLTETGNYNCVVPSKMTKNTNCVLFPWDWRHDLVRSAKQLDELIEKLRTQKTNENLQVDVVAHSAGGLLTRYYVRYGKRDVLTDTQYTVTHAGAEKISKVALVATPNYGSIPALQRAVVGQSLGLTTLPPQHLATMPGLYQTLPHPDRTFMIDINGDRIKRDLYSIDTWKQYDWSIFQPSIREEIKRNFRNIDEAEDYLKQFERYMKDSLRRAKRFHRALSVPQKTSPVKYIVFGSSCILTPSVCLLEEVKGQKKVRLYPHQVVNRKKSVPYERLMMGPGDGTVTKASLLARRNLNPLADKHSGDFPIDYSMFICERHATYPSNITFQDNLLNILLY